jgi:hypothetical protein
MKSQWPVMQTRRRTLVLDRNYCRKEVNIVSSKVFLGYGVEIFTCGCAQMILTSSGVCGAQIWSLNLSGLGV